MFGKEDELKELKTALQTLDCDMALVRSWQKAYEKTKKQLPGVRSRYDSAHSAAVLAKQDMELLEQQMKEPGAWSRERVKEFQSVIRELKKLQNAFDHEFVVSREDKELHLTYDTVLKLGMKAGEELEGNIILQSEIENAISLFQENLEKEAPDYFQLSFFYLNHSDADLVDLPPAERLKRVEEVFSEEFRLPMEELLTGACRKADTLRGTLESEKAASRRAARISEELQILWNGRGEEAAPEERAGRLMKQLCASDGQQERSQ